MAHAERTRLPGPAGTPIEIFDVVDARRELKVGPSCANPGNKLQKFVELADDRRRRIGSEWMRR
jgi:hypothetical protein